MTPALMFLGTASESGKSIMTAAFCRILQRKGVRVAPFKSQNMALNSGVTPDGREMGRAQIVQAEAAGIPPDVDMNPVLLKPTSDKASQIIVHGVVRDTMDAAGYYREKINLWPAVTRSYDRLAKKYDVIILEGAGSPVEINLKENDIVNMAMADYADARVILVADIDRGGVFASIVGTVELLEPKERERLIGFVINKFRGDAGLFQSGVAYIRQRTGFPVLGVVPHIRDLYLPGEDSVALDGKNESSGDISAPVSVCIIRLPHIANYTDFDALEADPRFRVTYTETPGEIERHNTVIIPGSKNVFFDYRFLETRGFTQTLYRYRSQGGRIVGVCGGYQMLGRSIRDPHGVESHEREINGMGLLPVVSEMQKRKVTERVQGGFCFPGEKAHIPYAGYEIHMGRTAVADRQDICFLTSGSTEEALTAVASPDGKVLGMYVHGIFDSDGMRDGFIRWVAGEDTSHAASSFSYTCFKENNFNRLADVVEAHVDVHSIMEAVGIDKS